MPNQSFSSRGGWWVVGQFALLLLMMFVPDLLPVWPAGFIDVSRPVGASSVFLSIIIVLFGVFRLGEGATPFPHPLEKAPLVRDGIYRRVRHPIYLGAFFFAFGVAFWRMNLTAVVLGGVLVVFMNAKANREEAWLVEKFPEYIAYRKKSKKFIPFLF